jgi:hypothetical protein
MANTKVTTYLWKVWKIPDTIQYFLSNCVKWYLTASLILIVSLRTSMDWNNVVTVSSEALSISVIVTSGRSIYPHCNWGSIGPYGILQIHVHENYLTMLTLSLTDQNSCIFLLYESIRNTHPYIVEISMNENLERTLLLYHLFKCKFNQPTQFNIKMSCFLFCLFFSRWIVTSTLYIQLSC